MNRFLKLEQKKKNTRRVVISKNSYCFMTVTYFFLSQKILGFFFRIGENRNVDSDLKTINYFYSSSLLHNDEATRRVERNIPTEFYDTHFFLLQLINRNRLNDFGIITDFILL